MKKRKFLSGAIVSAMIAGMFPFNVFASDDIVINETNFRDEVIRNYASGIDNNFGNGDGVLSPSELTYGTSFEAPDGSTINYLSDLSVFPLTNMNVNNVGLTSFNASLFPNLEILFIESNNLTTLNLTGCYNLMCLYADCNESLTSVDVTSCQELVAFDVFNCNLTGTLDLSGSPLLYEVIITDNNLSSVNITGDEILVDLYRNGEIETIYSSDDSKHYEISSDYKTFNFDDIEVIGIPAGEGISIDGFNFPSNLLRTALKSYDVNNDYCLSESEIAAIEELEIDAAGNFVDLTGLDNLNYLRALTINGLQQPVLYIDHVFLNNLQLFGEVESIYTNSYLLGKASSGRIAQGDDNITQMYADEYDTAILCRPENSELYMFGIDNIIAEINETNFPDSVIRDFAVSVDEDSDGILSLSEIINVKRIVIASESTVDLTGLEYFTYVTSLDVSFLGLTELSVISSMPYLQYLCCSANNLTELDLTNNPIIESVLCDDNKLTELIVSPEDNCWLNAIIADNNKFEELDITGYDCINLISFRDNELTTVHLENNPILNTVLLNFNNIGNNLTIENCPNIVTLELVKNGITEINVSGLEYLQSLNLAQNNITELDLLDNYCLVDLNVADTLITELNISNCTELECLTIAGVIGLSVDISKCPNLIAAVSSGTLKHWFTYSEYYFEEEGEDFIRSYSLVYDDTNTIVYTMPTSGITTTISPRDGAFNFALRLYTCALGRDAELAGARYWYNLLSDNTITGPDAAYSFLFGAEVESSNLSNAEFINRLYQTFMGRTPSEEEVNYWLGVMNQGQSKEAIFSGFVNSQEWANVCYQANIVSGTTIAPTVDKIPSLRILSFVETVYRVCLDRDGSEEEVMYWATALANNRIAASTVIMNFLNSNEYKSSEPTDYKYVNDVYTLALSREPDEDGLDYWTSVIESGVTREAVAYGFFQTEEFIAWCSYIGVNP